MFARTSSRSSGTFTMPKLGSIVQNGKFDAFAILNRVVMIRFQGTCATLFSTSALKRVLFPTFGKPKVVVTKVRQRALDTHRLCPFSKTSRYDSYYGWGD